MFRQLKQELIRSAVDASDVCAAFLKLYETYGKACAWMATPGRVVGAYDRERFWRLERHIETAWGDLSEQERVLATDVLFPAGTMVRAVLETFDGKVVSLI